jgi:photosystem II stability/assembly factor-like uncharacterized protein
MSAFACVWLLGSAVRANGRYPGANQLVVDPADAKRLVVRTTFGFLESVDSGAHWAWICEQAVTRTGSLFEPAVAVTADGTTLVGAPEGLARNVDRGCTWDHPDTPLTGSEIVDFATEPLAPQNVWAVRLSFDDAGFESSFVRSTDNGLTWNVISAQASFAAATIDVAPSMPSRVYVSGTSGAFLRSDDEGQHWQVLPRVSDKLPAYIAAVDPKNPERVYVRLAPISAFNREGMLVVSEDGGMSWKSLFSTKDPMFGFALSPDGSEVAVGAVGAGVQIASTTDYVFHPIADIKPVCLTWAPAGLYVCANESSDPYSIGFSADGHGPFTPLLRFRDVTMMECPAGSSTGSACSSLWCGTATRIGADGDCAPEASVDADATEGMGDADASADEPPEEASPIDVTAIEDAMPGSGTSETPPSGCKCKLGRSEGPRWQVALAACAVGALLRRRRRRRTEKVLREL